MCINANSYTLLSFTITIIRVGNDNLNVMKCYTTHCIELNFEKMGTESGIALSCGFKVAQARATKQRRQ